MTRDKLRPGWYPLASHQGAAHHYVQPTAQVVTLPKPAKPMKHGLPTNRPPAEVQKIVRKWWVVFAIDDSASMADSDPANVRYAAARSIVDLMIRCGGGKAGVVHWGSDAPPELAMAPVDVEQERQALENALTNPGNLRNTNSAAALRRARELLGEPASGHSQAVLLLTDAGQKVTPEIEEAILALPAGSVHFLLVDNAGVCNSAREAAWRQLPLGSFTRLDSSDPVRMNWQVANVLFSSAGLQLPPAAPTRRWRFPR